MHSTLISETVFLLQVVGMHIYIHIYVYIYVCVCVYIYVSMYLFFKLICTGTLSGVGGGRSHWETWAPMGLLQTKC